MEEHGAAGFTLDNGVFAWLDRRNKSLGALVSFLKSLMMIAMGVRAK